jgi:hypothetical protein
MVYWIIYILLDVLVNWYWIEKEKQVPNYILSTIVRGWFFILIGITMDIEPSNFISWALFTFCSFWVLFDLSLNFLRGKEWHYLGENSKIDQLGLKYPLPFWIAKLIAFFLMIYYFAAGL